MAEETSADSSNRATVAQTLAEVRGVRDLLKSETAAIQRQLDQVTGLPVVVAELKAQNADQEKRITDLETVRSTDGTFRRVHLPTMILSGIVLLVLIAGLVVSILSLIHTGA